MSCLLLRSWASGEHPHPGSCTNAQEQQRWPEAPHARATGWRCPFTGRVHIGVVTHLPGKVSWEPNVHVQPSPTISSNQMCFQLPGHRESDAFLTSFSVLNSVCCYVLSLCHLKLPGQLCSRNSAQLLKRCAPYPTLVNGCSCHTGKHLHINTHPHMNLAGDPHTKGQRCPTSKSGAKCASGKT